MKIFTRKNALVGYLVLNSRKRAVQKRIRRRRRTGLKVATYVAIGLVSAGVLAAVLFVALRRWHGEEAEVSSFDGDDIVGEYVTAPEPLPAA